LEPIPQIELITKLVGNLIVSKEDIVGMTCSTSVYEHVHTLECKINDKENKFVKFRSDDEVKFLGKNEEKEEFKEIFYGIAKNVRSVFDNQKDIDKIHFTAYSFAKLLTENKLEEFQMDFKKGYGEVVKKLLEPFSMINTEKVMEEEYTGSVYFDKITPLDAMMQLAYSKGWCINFEGKNLVFGPCKGNRETDVVLDTKDMISGTIPR